MPKLITLLIDNQKVSVPAGTLIVDAAKKAGNDIPVFCYHPKMEPVGMCRMCLVEIGRPAIDRTTGQVVMESDKPKIAFGPKLETACTTPVSDGMLVLSQSEKARASQKENLEFLLTSHPLDCPVCDKGGECPLQNLTMAHASPQSRYIFDEKHHAEKHVPLGELIWLDRERCIQCARCIRFQDEIAGEPVLAFYERGRNTDIITNSEPGFDSIFSGNTTDICPVGALTTADFRFGARPWEMKAAASICAQCPVGCNVTFNTRREAMSDGKVAIKRVMPRQNEVVNEVWMCDKGRFAYHFAESEDRLVKPQLRKNGELETVSWKEAVAEAGRKLHGEEIVVLAGGRLSNDGTEIVRSSQCQRDTANPRFTAGDQTVVVRVNVDRSRQRCTLQFAEVVVRGVNGEGVVFHHVRNFLGHRRIILGLHLRGAGFGLVLLFFLLDFRRLFLFLFGGLLFFFVRHSRLLYFRFLFIGNVNAELLSRTTNLAHHGRHFF